MIPHTPGPLTVVEDVNLQSGPLGALAYVSVAGARGRILAEAKANAARLAHCWNCHDELVAALRTMVKVADEAQDHWDADRDSKVGKYLSAMAGHLKGYRADLTAVHAVLQKAGAA